MNKKWGILKAIRWGFFLDINKKDNHNIKANYFEINKDGKKITQFFVNKDGFKKLEKIKNDIENFSTAVAKQLEKKNKKIQPPLLYNLTELQRDANKYFGFSAEKTLQIAQNLYEKHKLISYPRTESQYLGEKNFPLAKNKLNLFLKHYNYSDIVDRKRLNPANKRVFNDKKLTDHHALIPLNLPDKSLSPAEEKIFNLIVKRFISVFCKDHEYEAVNIVFQVKDYNFEANFKNISEQGWKKIYQDIEKENKEDEVFLKDIKQGDEFLILDRILQEKETRPPFHYTDSSLLKDMSDPAKYIKDEKLKEVFKGDTGLGTQSTRAGIIETLIKRDYARRKKRNIIITDKGIKLVEFLQKGKYTRQLLSPETTAQWEMALNTLQKKDIKELYDNCVNYVKNFVKEIALL